MASYAFESDAALQRVKNFAGERELAVGLQDGSLVSYADTTLSSTQMDTLGATAVSLVAAPGSGKVLQFLGAYAFNDFNSVAFSSVALDIRYQDSSGGLAGQFAAGFVASGADAFSYAGPQLNVTALANQALVASAPSDISAGNGSIKVRVYYRVVDSNLDLTT